MHCGQWGGDPSSGVHCVRVSRLEDQTPGVSTQPGWVAQLPRVTSVSIFPTSLAVPAITPVTTTSQSLLASCILWTPAYCGLIQAPSQEKSPNKNVLRTEKGLQLCSHFPPFCQGLRWVSYPSEYLPKSWSTSPTTHGLDSGHHFFSLNVVHLRAFAPAVFFYLECSSSALINRKLMTSCQTSTQMSYPQWDYLWPPVPS